MKRKQKQKKRIIKPLLICLLILFILIGPYYFFVFRPNDVDYNNVVKSTPQWTGVITMWDYPRLDQKTGGSYTWISQKIRAFEKKYPGVYIDFQGLTWDQGGRRIEEAITNDRLPDILPVGGEYHYMNKGILEPLDPYLGAEEKKNFEENAIKAVTYNGEMLAMPWMMTTYGMMLNLDMFQQKGVEAPVNGLWTYEEFVESLQALTYDSKGNGKITHYGFNSFIEEGYYNLWGIILSDGAEIFNERMAYTFNDDRAKSGVQKIIDLKQTYQVTHPKFGEHNSNQAWTTFYQDKNIAVIPSGTWSLNVLDRLQNEGKGFNYTVALYPTGSLGKPVAMSNMVGSYGVSKQDNEEKLSMIIEFLKFIVEDEHQADLGRLGVFPVKKQVGNIYLDDPLMTLLYQNLHNTTIIPPHPNWKEIDTILQEEIEQGILGNKTVDQLLKDAEARIAPFIRVDN
ncbi:extracellular solute-binding protein [Alkaliphilus transvaalensis]|uniref:extracellular solute-binding protein n=1 Tax=Alkaliphilus transvaalensis TaxID=114628 RepID=UPI00055249D0|nr:extracellular solute-binding protein [Alkaliphilus transvaalensis]